MKAAIHGVDLGHTGAHKDIGIGNWLSLLEMACVPRATTTTTFATKCCELGSDCVRLETPW